MVETAIKQAAAAAVAEDGWKPGEVDVAAMVDLVRRGELDRAMVTMAAHLASASSAVWSREVYTLHGLLSERTLPVDEALALYDQLASVGSWGSDARAVHAFVTRCLATASGVCNEFLDICPSARSHWAVVIAEAAEAAAQACDPDIDGPALAALLPDLEPKLSVAAGALGLYVAISLLYGLLCSSAEALVWSMDASSRLTLVTATCSACSAAFDSWDAGDLWMASAAFDLLADTIMWSGGLDWVTWRADPDPGAPLLAAAMGEASIVMRLGLAPRTRALALGAVSPSALLGIPWSGEYYEANPLTDAAVWHDDGSVVHEFAAWDRPALSTFVTAAAASHVWARDAITSLIPAPAPRSAGRSTGRGRGSVWPAIRRRAISTLSDAGHHTHDADAKADTIANALIPTPSSSSISANCVVKHVEPIITPLAVLDDAYQVVAALLDSSNSYVDVAYGGQADNRIMVLTRTAIGGWNAPVMVDNTEDHPLFMIAHDVDLDSSPDLVVPYRSSDNVVIYRNVGWDASFGAAKIILVPSDADADPYGVAVGDINGDSLLDLLVAAENSDAIEVFVGTGPGAFSPVPVDITSSLPTSQQPRGPRQVMVHDFDGDGHNEVIFTSSSSSGRRVIALRGRADLVSVPATSAVLLDDNSDGAYTLDIGDINNDGLDDVAVTLRSENRVVVYYNRGGLQFSPRFVAVEGIDQPFAVKIGDLNNDGWPDLVFSGFDDDELRWVPNDGVGTFRAPPQELDESLANARGVALADFDGDGKLDVVAASDETNGEIRLYTFDDTLSPFKPFVATLVTETANGAQGVEVGDVTGDGFADVVVASYKDDTVMVYVNDGNGKFGTTVADHIELYPAPEEPGTVTLADFDGNGWLDVAVGGKVSDTVEWWPNTGHGTFGARLLIGTCPEPRRLTPGDLNNDGVPDLVVGCSNREDPNPSLLVFLNVNSAAAWTRIAVFGSIAPSEYFSIGLGDIDLDGYVDVVFSASTLQTLAWSRNLAGTAFAPPTTIELLGGVDEPLGIALCDANGDGGLDLVAGILVDSTSSRVSVYMQTGPGTGLFAPPVDYGVFDRPFAVDCDDLTGDGMPDIALGDRDDDDIYWFRNLGSGTFGSATILLATADTVTTVRIRDVNSDGYNDIVTSSLGDDKVRILYQRPLLSATAQVAQLPPVATGVQHTLPQLHYALNVASRCVPQRIDLPAGYNISGCSAWGHLPVPAGVDWTVAGPAGLSGDSRPVIDCGASGGVMFEVTAGGSLVLENIRLQRATVGAEVTAATGLRVSGSGAELALANVTVTGFSSAASSALQLYSGMGGAMMVVNGGRVLAENCVFSRNTAADVGGMAALVGLGSVLELANCEVTGNSALGGGGGGVAVFSPDGRVATRDGCLFANNMAPAGTGGAVLVDSGATNARVSLASTRIVDNVAGIIGGGLGVFAADAARVEIGSGSLVLDNRAQVGGGVGVVESRYAVPKAPGFASSALARATASSVANASVVFLPGSILAGNHASYGGGFFACGAAVDAQQASLAAPTPVASIGGGYAFVCRLSDGSAPAIPTWVIDPVSGAPSCTAGGYGPQLATPPATLEVVDGVPSAASGVAFGGGAVVARDGLGQGVVDGLLVLRVKGPEVANVMVTGAELGIAFSTLTGSADLAGVGVAASDGVLPLEGAALELSVGDVSRTMSINVRRCPAGFGSDSESALAPTFLMCVRCGDGSYSDFESSESCQAVPECPGASQRPAANNATHLAACVCDRGFWSPEVRPTRACMVCPEGAECDGGRAVPLAKPGWKRTSTSEFVFAECPTPSACLGGRAGVECAPAYDPASLMCRSCASNAFRFSDGTCRKCPAMSLPMLYLFVGSVTMVALAAAGVVGCTARMIERDERAAPEAMPQSERYKLVPHALSVGLVYIQILGLLADAPVNWPKTPVRDALRVANAANIDLSIFATDCTIKDFATRYLSAVAQTPAWSLCGRLVFTLGPLVYIPLCRITLVFFDCTRLPDGNYYLDANLNEQCFSATWMKLLPVALVALVAYVLALPTFFAVTLWRNRHRLSEPAVFARYGPMYSSYRSTYFWFELAQLVKRLLIVSAALFFSRIQVWLLSVLVVIFAVFGAYQLKHEPYFFPVHNTLETRLNGSVLILLGCGVLFWADDFPNDLAYKVIAAVAAAAIGLSLTFLALAAGRDVHATIRSRRVVADGGRSDDGAELGLLSTRDEVFLSLLSRHASDLEHPALAQPVLSIQKRFQSKGELGGRSESSASSSVLSSTSSSTFEREAIKTRVVSFALDDLEQRRASSSGASSLELS
ncbi:uncharacterized protein AMSG_08413 [Thecamonas trahens ATCC 50062]|uniref:Uncharacterized protein n=1 Tax=Thecamonas trahens ATCC 50062 TaxID=461836 RepID=A0A0L0DJ53_THETB|nr:hypothetical protein AMSG_08413 [Thecamonas trahens ATCC 50062]KNC52434.1 hypothetical protein AMSG_08413 [Thecamonas trahens ATCC 50062]|eukprot:XP_013755475.1 hypothetical protein AMSG_08413 [Thecamonas trahens ATCC 50062]